MVVAKACKDEHTYQFLSQKPSSNFWGLMLEKTCFYLIPDGLNIENLGMVMDLVTSPGFEEISKF